MPFLSRLLGVLAGLLWIIAPAHAAEPKDCEPRDDLHFICGLAHPEDLVRVGMTRWIIASGDTIDGGGLFLIDSDAKTARKLASGDSIRARHDSMYPDCNEPPPAAKFDAHGLSLRKRATGLWTLYVVGHGGREAIEIFDVRSAGGAPPALSWIGCVRMPAAAGNSSNSVTSASDGTIYVTVLARPGISFQQIFDGQPSGDVYQWTVGSSGFERLPGLSLSANNGITISADEKELFVVATGTKDLVAVSRADPSHALKVAHFPSFSPDNVHYGPNKELIIAGMRDQEPSCGGSPKMVDGIPNITSCERGSIVVLVDPKTMAVRMLYDGRPNPGFSGAATGLVIGKQLWLSSFYENRVAYLTLP